MDKIVKIVERCPECGAFGGSHFDDCEEMIMRLKCAEKPDRDPTQPCKIHGYEPVTWKMNQYGDWEEFCSKCGTWCWVTDEKLVGI